MEEITGRREKSSWSNKTLCLFGRPQIVSGLNPQE